MAYNTFSKEYEQQMIDYNKKRSEMTFAHQFRAAYGLVEEKISKNCKTFIDYGCGEGAAADFFEERYGWIVEKFDPFKPEYKDKVLEPVDCVFTIDVLEHVEIKNVKNFIEEVNKLSNKEFVHCIDLWPAKKILADGRNAHVTLLNPNQWEAIFNEICSKSFDLTYEIKDNPDDLTSKRAYMKKTQPYPSRIFIKGVRK